MNIILIEPLELAADGRALLTGSRAAHVVDVLHAVPGHQVRVGLIDGPLGVATVNSIDHRGVSLQCAFEEDVPPAPQVDLLLALPRPKVLRRLWAQLAALGVRRILLTNAEKVERNYFDTHVLDEGVYRPLLVEGLQQARDTRLPLVTVHRQFKVLVEDHMDGLCGAGTRLVADHRAATPITKARRQAPSGVVLLAVGPEGGWNEFELALLVRHGFETVSMGPRTLRVDTACIALLSALAQ